MNQTESDSAHSENAFLAAILSKCGRAFGAEASARLLEHEPHASEGFGSDPFAGWQNCLATRIDELATAVAMDRPDIIVDQVQWTCAALASRGIGESHFFQGIRYLREVFREELPENVQGLAEAYIDRALGAQDAQAKALPSVLPGQGPFRGLVTGYLLAMFEGDARRGIQMVLDATKQGHSVADLYIQVVVPALREIGRLWQANEISIADEHFASAATRRLMSQLITLAPLRTSNGKTVVIAAVVGNRHDLGTQILSDFFEMDGWRPIHLGADVPIDAMIEVSDTSAVDLICLSATLSVQLPALREMIAALRKSKRGSTTKLLVGGQALKGSRDLAMQLGADDFAVSAPTAIRSGRALLGMDLNPGG